MLVGFMGAGKSSVGRALAARLGWDFVDTDEEVVRAAGMAITEIFRVQGDEGFRLLESEAVARVAVRGGQVVATGGGTILREENRRRLQATGRLVYLAASPDDIRERLVAAEGLAERPLLAGAREAGEQISRIEGLLANRVHVYGKADIVIDTAGKSLDEVASAVLEGLGLAAPGGAQPGQAVRTLRVGLADRSYDIVIGSRLMGQVGALARPLLGQARKALVVTHPSVGALYARPLVEGLEAAGFETRVAEVPEGEESKCLAQAGHLYDRCVEASLDRRSPMIALGGGVVGDLTGFVAATFLRGLPFIQVPTTLLAQVDSSVGGKTGINHPRAKNLIGAFHQPRLVVADVSTLCTLAPREYAAGLAEAVKHGVIADPEYFRFLDASREALLAREGEALARVVEGSCRIKAAVVEEDEREARWRMVLNLGHTVGHAVEAVARYGQILHGEAVAIGMAVAGRLALDLAEPGWTEADQDRLESLLSAFHLPVRMPSLPLEDLLSAMSLDKKSLEGAIHWVLPRAIGQVEIVPGLPTDRVSRVLVEMGAAPAPL